MARAKPVDAKPSHTIDREEARRIVDALKAATSEAFRALVSPAPENPWRTSEPAEPGTYQLQLHRGGVPSVTSEVEWHPDTGWKVPDEAKFGGWVVAAWRLTPAAHRGLLGNVTAAEARAIIKRLGDVVHEIADALED